MLRYTAEMSLACTYALRNPELAWQCAYAALDAALYLGRPDLAYQAMELMGAL